MVSTEAFWSGSWQWPWQTPLPFIQSFRVRFLSAGGTVSHRTENSFNLCFHPGPFRAPLRLLNRRQPWPIDWDGSPLVMLNGLLSRIWEPRWSTAGYYPHCSKPRNLDNLDCASKGVRALTGIQTDASSAAGVLLDGLARRKIAEVWLKMFVFFSQST